MPRELQRKSNRDARSSGLTIVELSIGLAIVGLIGLAVTSFTFATAAAWRGSTVGQTMENAAHVTAVRLQDELRQACYFGAWRAGSLTPSPTSPPAAVLLWDGDRNADGMIQQSELAMLEYDPTTRKLYARRHRAPKVDRVWSNAEFTSPTAIDTFGATGRRVAVVSNVTGLTVRVRQDLNSTVRPRLEYRMNCFVGDASTEFVGVVALRAPSRPPT